MEYKEAEKYWWGNDLVVLLSDQGNEAFVKIIRGKNPRDTGLKKNVLWNELRPLKSARNASQYVSLPFQVQRQQSLPFGECVIIRSFREYVEKDPVYKKIFTPWGEPKGVEAGDLADEYQSLNANIAQLQAALRMVVPEDQDEIRSLLADKVDKRDTLFRNLISAA